VVFQKASLSLSKTIPVQNHHFSKTILLSNDLEKAKTQLLDFKEWPVILKRVRGTWGEFVEKANDIDENSLVDYEEDADNVEYMRQKSIVKNNSFPTHMDCDDDDDDDVL
jgi:glutathione synthase/RimK-type ligase-like ATP-grasp enzyme